MTEIASAAWRRDGKFESRMGERSSAARNVLRQLRNGKDVGSEEMGSDDEEERALMNAYVGGDGRAFRALFARLAPRLDAFFARSFQSEATRLDLLQNTFLRVHASRSSFEPAQRVRPWIFTIAARVRADLLRSLYRMQESANIDQLEAAADDALDPEAALDARGVEGNVRAAVAALPEGQRVVVHLHRFEGLTFVEIGAVLGLEPTAVRVRAFRAYAVLRDALAAHARDEGSS